ncbi:heavy metal translocating P-type ATPase [Roseisalinus antarcticus]|uniref:Copper-transporting P-type ATPase n=1 Tax=Roseisalinus antarcticus TaxID=254357 RepID=A0A1Y5TV14_9RHOB|nr:heavy metal translocating P-type ATPase [Roseisalinus antarcticus]SLN72605.1 Copper-transporting P-type ATPase [Roseisalinus antarcticus]
MGKQEHFSFGVDKLSCAGCVGRAERALSAVPGVEIAQVNLATRNARVAGQAGATDLSEALARAGYPAVPRSVRLEIEGMHCASCLGKVERALQGVPGVLSAQVNLATNGAEVETLSDNDAALIETVGDVGYSARPVTDAVRSDDRQAAEARRQRTRFLTAAALTLPVFVTEMGGHVFPPIHHAIAGSIGMQAAWLIQMMLTTIVLAWPGREFFRIGVPALLHGAPEMNSLVALGAGAAWSYSAVATLAPDLLPPDAVAVYFEAAAVIVTLILLGRWLEARARGRTGEAIRALMALAPSVARVRRGGDFVDVPLAEVVGGDVVQVRPGERVPVDGAVIEGRSHVDESMLTGEPMPSEKGPGAALTGGTLNGGGALTMRAGAVGAETVLSRIVAMVEDAQGARLPVQDLVNRITGVFVPAVLGVAVLTFGLWLAFGPDPALTRALVAGVSVLIIACPCAMGLAVPVSIMVGTGRGAEIGVLFRQGDALQALHRVTRVVFDKTGTLTKGKPSVVTVEAPEEILALAAAIEARSEHPLARAVVAAAEGLARPEVTEVRSVTGQGIGAMSERRRVLVGSARFLAEEGVALGDLGDRAKALGAEGQTLVLVAVDGVARGLLGVSDAIKPGAAEAVARLKTQGLRVAMVSGDTEAAARAVAALLGIDEVIAGVLPDGKVAAVRGFQADGPVAFVGDGINDAPALAAADVGIAIGTGTDIAVESADVVLVSGDPGTVARALTLSRATMANIRQNLGWAFGYNVLLIPVAAGALAIFGGPMLSPALAAGAMAASSVLVVSNALRLKRAAR